MYHKKMYLRKKWSCNWRILLNYWMWAVVIGGVVCFLYWLSSWMSGTRSERSYFCAPSPPKCARGGLRWLGPYSAPMVWKRWFLSNMAIFGIYDFWGVILTIFSHLTISDASSYVIIRGHPTTSTSMARCWGWNCHQSRPFLEPGFFQSASKVAFFKGQGRVYPGPSVPMVFN